MVNMGSIPIDRSDRPPTWLRLSSISTVISQSTHASVMDTPYSRLALPLSELCLPPLRLLSNLTHPSAGFENSETRRLGDSDHPP
jgi:hypothetical protein